MDAEILRLTLDTGANRIEYSHGPKTATGFAWPGDSDGVKLNFYRTDGTISRLTFGGLWGMFRLVADGNPRLDSRNGDVLFDIGEPGARATLRLSAGGLGNPFEPGLMASYTCEDSL